MEFAAIIDDAESRSIPGYEYGTGVARSPVSLEELRQKETTLGWSEEDARVLQRHGSVGFQPGEYISSSRREAFKNSSIMRSGRPEITAWWKALSGLYHPDYPKNQSVQTNDLACHFWPRTELLSP